MIKAVLFDMDGVILETERLYAKAVPAIAQKLGYSMDKPFFLKTLGVSNQECRKLYIETYGSDYPYDKAVALLFQYISDYNRTYGMPLKDGVMETLTALKKQGLKIALATSASRRIVTEIFNLKPQLDALFDGKVCGDEVTSGKPSPEIYETAAALVRTPPKECIGVEDAPSGVRAIRASGARSVMIPDLMPYSPSLVPYVDHVLHSIRDLYPLIQQLNAQ